MLINRGRFGITNSLIMNDIEKILQALARLEAGQQVLQGAVNQQGKAITGLQEGQQIMQQDIKSLQEGQKTLQTDVKGLQTDVKGLQTDVKSLKEGQDTLELKVEAIGAFQQKSHAQSQ